MKDSEIDEVLERGAAVPYQLNPALLTRVSASITNGLQSVRPIGPVWVVASLLTLVSALIALTCASSLGLYGIRKLTGAEMGAIFPTLGIFTWLSAMMSAGEMAPGSRRWITPPMLLLVVMLGWLALDAVLFRDYKTQSFVPAGIPCLRAGLMVAIPTGVGSWIVLRRGFAVNPQGAGLAAGTFAGLAGLMMLELHCTNLLALHIMAWHTAVIPISALAGALLARISARRS